MRNYWVRDYKVASLKLTVVLLTCTVQAAHHRAVRDQPVSRGGDAVLMGVIFLVGKQRRLETGAAAMQNVIARIEDRIDRTSAMGQELLA